MSLSLAPSILSASTSAFTAQRVRSPAVKLRVRVYPGLNGGLGGVNVTSAVFVSPPAASTGWALAA